MSARIKTPQEGDVYIIINSSLMLSEDFTVTPEKQKAIDEANKKLDKGDKKEQLTYCISPELIFQKRSG